MDIKEYDATSTNAKPCYSNLQAYGAYGMVRSIVAPKPVTAQPWITSVLGSDYQPTHYPIKPQSGVGYKTLRQTGKPSDLK